MNTPFISAVAHPVGRTEPALFFAFQNDSLLIYLEDEVARIPCLDDFGELGLPAVRQHYLGRAGELHCYAVEMQADVVAPQGMAFEGLRQLFGRLDEDLFQVGGRAVQIVNWDRTHQFCSQCGTPTQPHARDRARECPECGLMSFPRLSPAIIVLIERGREFLLARSPRFPSGRYSIIAGFVEPGETLEEAVAREVLEEVSIEVRDIRYFGSQPWPFPNSLMLGFTAQYASGEIRIDEDEIEDAGWYTPDNLPDLPDGISISRQLINWFLDKHRNHDQSR